MSREIKVAFLNKHQKVWFIRASSGQFAPNFKHAGIIAIRHLEEAMGNKLGTELPTEEEITRSLLQNEKYYEFVEDKKTEKTVRTLNRSGRVLLSQIKRFANEIEAGDVVVTKNEIGGYNIGICSDSQAYIENEHVVLPRLDDDAPAGPTLRYKFRKKVVWGPSVSHSDLPHTVRRATRGQQTISSLSDHKVKIFHLIYPFFTDGEHLYFSNKIRKQGDINALVVGKLFENVSLASRFIEELVGSSELNLADIADQLNKSLFADGEFVACQAEFMSPGDMWCKIPLSAAFDLTQQVAAGVLVCLLLTGQSGAAQLGNVSEVSPSALMVYHVNSDSPSTTIFNEKFKPAEPSKGLKGLADKLKGKSSEVDGFESGRATKEIQENLKLQMPSIDTSRLEKFSYGINVIEFRGLNENN